MRKYTVIFLEQRLGMKYATPIEGKDGVASFTAADDDAALSHIGTHLARPMAECIRADLSSMAIVTDGHAAGGTRLVDDSHDNPHFQDMQLSYNARTKELEVDFESTGTAHMADLSELRRPNPVYRKM